MTGAQYNILLGFDFGLKRIGVAVGQTITQTARPLNTLAATEGLPNITDVKALIDQWRPDAFIIGIPLNMDGTEQPITQAARQLKQWLVNHFKLPVHEVDERLSTKQARERIYNIGGLRALKSTEIDSVAAQIILEDWLSRDRSP